MAENEAVISKEIIDRAKNQTITEKIYSSLFLLYGVSVAYYTDYPLYEFTTAIYKYRNEILST